MNPIKSILLTLLIAIATSVYSNENIFLERSYWKGNPTLLDVKAKAEAGNDPTQLNEHGFDALVYALLEKAPGDVLDHLIGLEGNDVNKITHDGRTYIFWAAYMDNLDFMTTLVKKGADLKHIDDYGYSIMNFAAVTGLENPAIYDFLIEHGADVKTEKNRDGANSLLLISPHLESKEMINYFTDKGLSLSDADKFGNGLFNYASAGGNVDLLKWMVGAGVTPHAEAVNGKNAMHFAAKGLRRHSNGLEVFEYLQSLKINPLQMDSKRETPLLIAAANTKYKSVIMFFVKSGASVDDANTSGKTALINAAEYNDLEIVQAILPVSTEVNKVDKDGRSALTYAVRYNSAKVVDVLLEAGANADVKDKDGKGLMNYLVESYKPSSAEDYDAKSRLLSKNGVSFEKNDPDGNNLFHLAAQENALHIMKQAHGLKLDVNAKNKEGMTPLLIAAMKSNSIETLKYLVEIGADPSQKTEFEESVFDLARENKQLRSEGGNFEFLQN